MRFGIVVLLSEDDVGGGEARHERVDAKFAPDVTSTARTPGTLMAPVATLPRGTQAATANASIRTRADPAGDFMGSIEDSWSSGERQNTVAPASTSRAYSCWNGTAS
jgi:hypothetical protein